MISGRATPDATREYATRFAAHFDDDFYRPLAGLTVSSLGMGTYLGECDDREDARYTQVVERGLASGVNLVDTAINYRCQRSERAVGQALTSVVGSGRVRREEIVVCTKAGYVPLDGTPPDSRALYDHYLDREYFSRGTMSPTDLVAGGHCLTPSFISNQIDRSLSNLELECIDLFYIHNPEQQLDSVDRERFSRLVAELFGALEEERKRGRIGAYGCATWNGFRSPPSSRSHLSLADFVAIARKVAGRSHGFRAVQLPINLGMTEAVRSATQPAGGHMEPVLDSARRHGVSVVASASLMQAQLARNLPGDVRSIFPRTKTDAQCAIAFVRSLPVAAALVGMRSVEHLQENISAATA